MPLAPIRFEHEIAINDHTHGKAWTDCQCRLDIQIAPDDLLASLIERICSTQTERLEKGCVVSIVRSGSKL